MGYVKQDDARGDHPKLVEAGPLAAHLDDVAIYYCNRNRTDGFVPRGQVRKLVDWHGIFAGETKREAKPVDALALANTLVEVGRWEPCEGGFRVHDYLDHQPSAEQIDASRTASRKRVARHRAQGNPPSNGVTPVDVTADVTPYVTGGVTPPEEGRLKNYPPKPPQGGRARDLEQYRTDCASYAAEHFPDLGEQGREAVRQATSGPDRAASHGAVVEFVDRWWRKTWRDPSPAEERVA